MKPEELIRVMFLRVDRPGALADLESNKILHRLIVDIVLEERERCARIAEQFTHKCPETGSCFEHHKAEVIARMIRANGSTERQA